MPKIVTPSIPKNTVVPIDWRISAGQFASSHARVSLRKLSSLS